MRQVRYAHFAKSQNGAEKCAAAFQRRSGKCVHHTLVLKPTKSWKFELERRIAPARCGYLNLGFTSGNFRLNQGSLRVCYFWLSSFEWTKETPA